MKENIESLTLSSRKRRIAAFLIDHFIMTFIMVITVLAALDPGLMDQGEISHTNSVIAIVLIPGFLIYFAKDSINGISPGRWIMGIMVRKEIDFSVIPSPAKLFLRNLFLLMWPVEFLVLALNARKQRLGDSAVKTVVLENPNPSRRLRRISALAGIFLAFFLAIYLLAGGALRNSDLYKVAVQNIEVNQEVLDETGGIRGYGRIPTGDIKFTNGFGEAQLEITVIGTKKDMTVRAYLEKKPQGLWHLLRINK